MILEKDSKKLFNAKSGKYVVFNDPSSRQPLSKLRSLSFHRSNLMIILSFIWENNLELQIKILPWDLDRGL